MAKCRASGEGNIKKRKDGRWEGRYTAGHTVAQCCRLWHENYCKPNVRETTVEYYRNAQAV